MTMLQIGHIEIALYKAILERGATEAVLSIFRSKYVQLCRAKDKTEWIDYDSIIPWKWHRDILYEFFSDEAKFLLMLED